MDLVDAIAANMTARSPVELSLSSLFPREYSALYKGIQEMSRTTQTDSTEAEKSRKSQIQARTLAIAELIPTPKEKQFYLWAIDVTPLPRPYAKTLEERTIIYQPNTIKGNKPINIGHLLRFEREGRRGFLAMSNHAVGKQRLLLNASCTAEVENEESWVQLSFLAYVQLWAARKLALTLPRPWERYLPQKAEGFLTPSQVQRDLNRIITEIGTPANSPKRRGFGSGQTTGMIQAKRTRHEVIKKGKKEKKPEPSPPIAI